jgi:hypothetical protein
MKSEDEMPRGDALELMTDEGYEHTCCFWDYEPSIHDLAIVDVSWAVLRAAVAQVALAFGRFLGLPADRVGDDPRWVELQYRVFDKFYFSLIRNAEHLSWNMPDPRTIDGAPGFVEDWHDESLCEIERWLCRCGKRFSYSTYEALNGRLLGCEDCRPPDELTPTFSPCIEVAGINPQAAMPQVRIPVVLSRTFEHLSDECLGMDIPEIADLCIDYLESWKTKWHGGAPNPGRWKGIRIEGSAA